MSAHFKVSEIGFFSLEQWPVTVCAWRGCCIEVFARAEHSVADCLRTLEKAGLSISKDAHSPFATNRLKALSAAIGRHTFGGHGKVAQTRITAWEEQAYVTRACLAHGKINATANGITIQHIAFDGKVEKVAPPQHISRIRMLEILAEIEQAQIMLHHQLGQIKALAASAKPIPTS